MRIGAVIVRSLDYFDYLGVIVARSFESRDFIVEKQKERVRIFALPQLLGKRALLLFELVVVSISIVQLAGDAIGRDAGFKHIAYRALRET